MKELALLGLFDNRDYIVTRVPYGHQWCVGTEFTFDTKEMEFVSKEDKPRYIPLFKVVMHGFSLMLASECTPKMIKDFKLMAEYEAERAIELSSSEVDSHIKPQEAGNLRVMLYNELGMECDFDDIVFYGGSFFRRRKTQSHIDNAIWIVRFSGVFNIQDWVLLNLSIDEHNSLTKALLEQVVI